MDSSDQNARNDNYDFAAMICNPDRQFADQAITLTVEGLFDREVSHYDVAKSLFDMALSLAAGDGTGKDETANWMYLLDYFFESAQSHRQMLIDALNEDSA